MPPNFTGNWVLSEIEGADRRMVRVAMIARCMTLGAKPQLFSSAQLFLHHRMHAMGTSAAVVNLAWLQSYGKGKSADKITQSGNSISILSKGMLGEEETTFIIDDPLSISRKESRRMKGHFNNSTMRWDGEVLVMTTQLAVEGNVGVVLGLTPIHWLTNDAHTAQYSTLFFTCADNVNPKMVDRRKHHGRERVCT
jgi:hypothetical protein